MVEQKTRKKTLMFLSQLLYSVHTVSTSGFFHDVSFHVRFFLAVQLFHNWFYLCQTLHCVSKRKVCLHFANIAVKTKLFAHTKKNILACYLGVLMHSFHGTFFRSRTTKRCLPKKCFYCPFLRLMASILSL